jgi:shikimate dehydrogenase
MDSVAPDAQTFGAVNTIVVEQHADGTASIAGHNTDAQGFIGALRQGGFEPRAGNSAVVVGAGGVARAVVFGLLDSGMGEVLILNRTLERAQALTSDLEGPAAHLSSGNSQEAHQVRALPLTPETLIESACAADLLVNATTVGMWPHTDRSIWPAGAPVPAHLTVFDVIYNPLETRLLRQARQSGARGMDGLEMLVQQGALAFDLWTDQATGVDEIAALMRKTLRVWENP